MIRLFTGDALTVLSNIEDGSVKAVVTSPPYNIGKKYNSYDDDRVDYFQWVEDWCGEILRVLADDGHFFLQVGGTPTRPTLPHQILEAALRAGFTLQNEIVWVKNISIGDESYGHFKPINSERFLNGNFEFIFHLTKRGNTAIDRLAVGVPYKDASNVKRWKHGKDRRCAGSVWFIPYETVSDQGGKFHHPAGFPVELPLRCLRLAGVTTEDLILDPFAGTGTTLVAAQRLGLTNAIGIELDPTYTKTARERLSL